VGAKLGSKGTMSELNLTPLIDIVLVVLIGMMVNMPIEIQEMGLKLPSAEVKNKPKDLPTEQLVIALYENGELALNRRMMTEEVLFYEVTRRLRPMKNKNVFIDGFPTLPYGRIVDMVDLAREAGAAKVGLAKMKSGGPLPANSVAPGTMPRSVMVGSPTAVGGISEEKADETFKPYIARLESCYYPLLGQYRDLSGRMMLRFTIGPDGELMNKKISSSTVEPQVRQLTECVEQILPTVKFEPLGERKTAIVQYPILFSPG
jgi:TonB family protein